ncbi:MAG: hypothetical protein AAFV78_01940, partial [Bacteroidota bacterium]
PHAFYVTPEHSIEKRYIVNLMDLYTGVHPLEQKPGLVLESIISPQQQCLLKISFRQIPVEKQLVSGWVEFQLKASAKHTDTDREPPQATFSYRVPIFPADRKGYYVLRLPKETENLSLRTHLLHQIVLNLDGKANQPYTFEIEDKFQDYFLKILPLIKERAVYPYLVTGYEMYME